MSDHNHQQDQPNQPRRSAFIRSGKWTPEEKDQFEQACLRYGWGHWVDIKKCIPTRTRAQVQRHAHKLPPHVKERLGNGADVGSDSDDEYSDDFMGDELEELEQLENESWAEQPHEMDEEQSEKVQQGGQDGKSEESMEFVFDLVPKNDEVGGERKLTVDAKQNSSESLKPEEAAAFPACFSPKNEKMEEDTKMKIDEGQESKEYLKAELEATRKANLLLSEQVKMLITKTNKNQKQYENLIAWTQEQMGKLDDMQRINESLSAEKKKLVKVEKANDQLMNEVQKLKGEVESLTSALRVAHSTKTEIEQEKICATAAKEELVVKVDRLKASLTALQDYHTQLEKKEKQSTDAKEKEQQKALSGKVEIEKMQGDIKKLRVEKRELQRVNMNLLENIKKINADSNAREREIKAQATNNERKLAEIQHSSDSLSATNQQLGGKIQTLKAEVERLSSSLTESKAYTVELEKEKQEALSAKLLAQAEVKKVQGENQKIIVETQDLRRRNVNLNEHVDILTTDVSARDRQIKTLSAENEKLVKVKSTNDSLTTKNDELMDKNQQIQLEVERLKSSLAESKACTMRLEREKQDAISGKESEHQAFVAAQAETEKVRRDNETISRESQEVQSKNVDLTKQIEELAKTLVVNSKKIAELGCTNNSLSTKNQELIDKNRQLNVDLKGLKSSLVKSKVSVFELEREKQLAIKEKENALQVFRKSQAEIETHRGKNKKLQQENLNLTELIDSLGEDVSAMKRANETLSTENSKLLDKNQRLEEQKEQLESSLAESNTSNKVLEEEKQNALTSKEKQQQSLEELLKKFTTLEKDCEVLRYKNASLTKEVDKVKAEAAQTMNSLASNKETLVKVQRTNQSFLATNRRLMEENDQYQADAEKFKKLLGQAQSSNAKLEEEKREVIVMKEKGDQTIVKLKSEVGSLQGSNQKLNENKLHLQEEKIEYEEKIKQQEKTVQTLADLVDENRRLKINAEEEKREAVEAKERVQQSLLDVREELEGLRDIEESLRRKNIELSEQVDKLNVEMDDSQEDDKRTIRVLTKAYEHLETDLANSEKAVQDLSRKNTDFDVENRKRKRSE